MILHQDWIADGEEARRVWPEDRVAERTRAKEAQLAGAILLYLWIRGTICVESCLYEQQQLEP